MLELGAESLLCLLLLTIQGSRRLWECAMVTSWGSSRMSLVAYVVRVAAASCSCCVRVVAVAVAVAAAASQTRTLTPSFPIQAVHIFSEGPVNYHPEVSVISKAGSG